MAPTRQELVLQFMIALAPTAQFSKESINSVYVLACSLADKYLENS
jgi:hypothetical protein